MAIASGSEIEIETGTTPRRPRQPRPRRASVSAPRHPLHTPLLRHRRGTSRHHPTDERRSSGAPVSTNTRTTTVTVTLATIATGRPQKTQSAAPGGGSGSGVSDTVETSPVRAPPSAKKRRVQAEYDYGDDNSERELIRDVEREKRERDLERYGAPGRPNVLYDPNGPSALSLAPDADTDVRMLSAYPHLHVPSRLPSPPTARGRLPSESPPPPATSVPAPTPTSTRGGRGGGKGSRGGRTGRGGGKTGTTTSVAAPVGLGLALYNNHHPNDDLDSQSPSTPDPHTQPKPKTKRPRKSKHNDTGLPESFFPSSSTPVSSLPPRLVVPERAESVGSASGTSSPAGTPFLPLDHPLPPLPAVGKVDHATLVKRAIQLEENQRKIWVSLARKDIPKAYKLQSAGFLTKLTQSKNSPTLSPHTPKNPTRAPSPPPSSRKSSLNDSCVRC
ncbi:hypothetical protein FRC12_007957 [Ceratobasidium sp. 428]|nr:hypothetical protein FRC12_007957 [Ceratobasidium sp. 428]